MKTVPPPLRFLALVVGGWVCIRATMMLPERAMGVAPPVARAEGAPRLARQDPAFADPIEFSSIRFADNRNITGPEERQALTSFDERTRGERFAFSALLEDKRVQQGRSADVRPAERLAILPPYPTLAAEKRESRWSGSAWVFAREGEAPSLAAAGTLGGSQIGGRISYRLNENAARPLAVSARFYAPLDALEGAEVAVGVAWKPLEDLPVTLLAERRQAIGPDGRSAFSLLAYGGVSERRVLGPVHLDAYAQAGVVGSRSRDLFADGSMQLTVPVDASHGVRLGAGLWGAAQPGLSRLDIGPHLSVRLPIRGVGARLTAEWRVRIAGDAAPASGPAITLGADF